MKTRLKYTFLLAFLFPVIAYSQSGTKVFSLDEAQQYALKHNYSLQNARIDMQLAKKKIWETTAIGLPQLSASLSYQYMIDVPTTLLPDFITPEIIRVNNELFGLEPTAPVPATQFFPAQFGTEQNATVQGTLSQLIFNGQYLVGLQAARVFYKSSEKNLEKAEIEIRQSVNQSYYLVVVFGENRRILQNSVSTLERTLFEMQEMFRVGLVEDLAVDQMQYNLGNLKNALSALDRQLALADKLLKYQMGLPLEESISLRDSIPVLLARVGQSGLETGSFQLEKHIDYLLVETGEQLQYLNLRREQSNYLPVVSAFATRQENAMRDKFNFFDSSQEWYPTTIVGVSLSLPIFTSGMQHARVQQARMELDKIQNTKKQVAQGLALAAEQARINYNNAFDKYLSEKDNFKLGENIYNKTLLKFKEGIAGSTDLTQAYNQFLSAQSAYFTAILELLNAKTNLDKAYQLL